MKRALPLARQDSLIIKELPEEILVYDQIEDKAHCLNQTAARVWRSCDGRTSVKEIARSLGGNTNSKSDEDIVWLALDQLRKFNLLETAPTKPAHLAGMTRRQAVARIGLAAIALPVVVSIVAPTAHAQGSTFPPGICCVNPSDCASNNCVQDPTCTTFGGVPGNANSSTKGCA
jgi:hypothetical protein